MGKTTLYHPVSLHVLRGATEYCGFKLGTIRQTTSMPDDQMARYIVSIVGFPKKWDKQPLDVMQDELQECFMDDIRVYQLRRLAKTQIWACDLVVKIMPEKDAQQ